MSQNDGKDFKPVKEYEKIMEYYFEGSKIDIKRMIKQPKEGLISFIQNEIVPNWENSLQPVKLHQELSDNNFIKPFTYKQYLKELKKERRTISQIQKEHKELLLKNNPVIKPSKLEKI